MWGHSASTHRHRTGSVSGAVRRTRSLNRDLIAVDEHEAAVVEPEGPPPRGIGEANAAHLDCVADVAPSSTTVARLSFSVSGTPAPASRPRCAMRDCERWPDQQAYTCSSPAASIGRRASRAHRAGIISMVGPGGIARARRRNSQHRKLSPGVGTRSTLDRHPNSALSATHQQRLGARSAPFRARSSTSTA